MNLKKKLLPLVLFGTLSSIAQAKQPAAIDTYNNLDQETIALFTTSNGPMLGSAVRQKNNPDGQPSFCRRTNAIVPKPSYTYDCYYETLTGADAEQEYANAKGLELSVSFVSAATGSHVVGSSWKEKFIGTAQAAICVKTEPVVPHPRATYTCYATFLMGGAVSGGN